MSEEAAVKASLEVVDGVLKVSAEVDIVDLLEKLAKQSTSTVDDVLINFVKMARSNLDWKGAAAEYFKGTIP